jgi:glycogen(starch) synthase
MRILLWSEAFWPSVGGSEIAATTLIDALRQRDHEFIVITRKHAPDEQAHSDYQGVAIHRLPVDQDAVDRMDFGTILPMRHQVATIKTNFKPDVIHISLPGPSLLLHRLTEASCYQAPTLVSLHVPLSDGEYSSRAPAGQTLMHADWVTACSKSLLEQTARRMPAISDHSSVVYNGLPMPAVKPTPLEFDRPHLLCVGRLVEQKGFDTAIAALATIKQSFPAAHLSIAGDGELRGQLEHHAQELGVANAVDFMGWVKPEHIATLINTAAIVLMPSRWEPFGLVALQAAQMARPVVGAAIDGLVEVVEHGVTGLLVKPTDAADLAQAVIKLLSNPGMACEVGRCGRRHAERFGVDPYADAFEQLYMKLADQHAGQEQVLS